MDSGGLQSMGVTRAGHDLVTKPPPPDNQKRAESGLMSHKWHALPSALPQMDGTTPPHLSLSLPCFLPLCPHWFWSVPNLLNPSTTCSIPCSLSPLNYSHCWSASPTEQWTSSRTGMGSYSALQLQHLARCWIHVSEANHLPVENVYAKCNKCNVIYSVSTL